MSQQGNGEGVAVEKLQVVVEKYDDRPDQCTIFPSSTEGIELMSTWITAREESFVSLRTMR